MASNFTVIQFQRQHFGNQPGSFNDIEPNVPFVGPAKTFDFQNYYNAYRTHAGLDGRLPEPAGDGSASSLSLDSYRWQRHCRGLYHTPIAA